AAMRAFARSWRREEISGRPCIRGGAPCRQSPPQLKQQTASTIGFAQLKQQTPSTIGFVGMYFTTATAPIPVQPKKSGKRIGTAASWSRRAGNASRTSTTPSRVLCLGISLHSSSNSKRRDRVTHDLGRTCESKDRVAHHVYTKAALARLRFGSIRSAGDRTRHD